MSVGRDKPGRVGGSVEVTNAGGAAVCTSCDSFTQEPRLRLMSSIQVQIFFIERFYLGNIKAPGGGWNRGDAESGLLVNSAFSASSGQGQTGYWGLAKTRA